MTITARHIADGKTEDGSFQTAPLAPNRDVHYVVTVATKINTPPRVTLGKRRARHLATALSDDGSTFGHSFYIAVTRGSWWRRRLAGLARALRLTRPDPITIAALGPTRCSVDEFEGVGSITRVAK